MPKPKCTQAWRTCVVVSRIRFNIQDWGGAMAVTLINVFSVPKGKEDEFVKWWQDVKANITKQPGFISGKFHKSLKPDSKFNFINVAMWENEGLYWKAYEKSAASMKSKLEHMGAEMVPALYNVAFEY